MRRFLLKALDIEREELGPVSLLLTISFFIGIFLVTFDVGTSALFMDGERGYGQDHLPKAFIASGLLGAIVAFVFVNLQKRIAFSILVKWTLIAIFCYVTALSFILESTHSKEIIFSAFTSLGALNALGILCFYGAVTRSFNLKNQKRLTGTVDKGQMLATAIAFFIVPVMDTLPFFTDTIHYLFVSFSAVFISLVLFFIYTNKYPAAELVKLQITNKQEVVANVDTFIYNKYIRLISLIFLLSGIAAIFVDYSFLSLTAEQYPDPNDFASFLGLFGGTLTVFSILLQELLGDKIIESQGVKIALLILPVLLGVFTIVSSIMGSFAATVPLLIIFIGLSKFFYQTLKETFEEPLLKNFFYPIEKNIRHDVQAKVEGGFQQIAVFMAGALILGLLSVLTFFDFDFKTYEFAPYSYFLVFVFIGYGYFAFKLYEQYQKTLKDTLASQHGKDGLFGQNQFSVTETLTDELKSPQQERVIYSLKLMEKLEPVMFENILIGFATDPNSDIRAYALQRINDLKLISAVNSVKKISESEKSPVIKKLVEEALRYIDETENIPLGGERLAQLVKSKNPEDREFAAKILSRGRDDHSILHLLLLMRDPNPKVRHTAIISSGKCKHPELWPLLIDSLSIAAFANAAAGSLAVMGAEVMPFLEASFHKSGQTLQTQLKIVQIYGKIGGQKAIEHLWDKIDFPAKKIRTQVLLALSHCGFRVNEDTIVKIKQTLQTDIGNAAWNVAALSEIGDHEHYLQIREAMEEEIRNDFDKIFLLLSFIYDSQAIRLVKENLESGTLEGKVYGIELLDVFLEDDLQPLLFPLLEDISQEERNEKLQNYFPREKLDGVSVLLHMINRDYNYVNRWTKACAIYAFSYIPDYKITDDLIANLFNPDSLLRETAGWVINRLDKQIFESVTERLSPTVKKELEDHVINKNRSELRIERILQLKKVNAFKNVPGVILADLEEVLIPIKFKQDEIIINTHDTGSIPMFVISEGTAGIFENGELITTIEKNQIVGELLVLESEQYNYLVKAKEEVLAYRIEKSRFFELMTNNYELAKEFIHVIGSRWSASEVIEEVKS